MKIYEMIFHKGTYEQTRLFYIQNNKASRQHFIENMRLELEQELKDFNLSCKSQYKHDLFALYKKVQKESHLHLDAMEDEFTQNSNQKRKLNYFYDILLKIILLLLQLIQQFLQ